MKKLSTGFVKRLFPAPYVAGRKTRALEREAEDD